MLAGIATPGDTSCGQLVLSLFPGIDLLGRGFEMEGFCVVRGPDLIWGGDIRLFTPLAGRFDGLIAGSPCQDYSSLNRDPGDYGDEMIGEFARCVLAARPAWWLLENVPGVPNVQIAGYAVQRFDLYASEFGLRQRRLRHFQFGSLDGRIVIIQRQRGEETEACALASEGERRASRRGWPEFVHLQGLPADFDLPELTLSAKYRAVGNGVPVPMARAVARAINGARLPGEQRVCECGCGRPVTGRQLSAGPACRKRLERQRRGGGQHRVLTFV